MAKKSAPVESLRSLVLASGLLFIVLGVLAVLLMKDATYQLTLGHLAKDTLASRDGVTVLAPATRPLFDVQLRYIVATIMAISAAFTLLAGTKLRKAHEQDIKNKIRPFRWIYLAVTSALMLEVVALLSGINDLLVLKVLAGLVAASSLLSWLGERQNKDTKKPTWFAFVLSLFTGLLPWILIFISTVATTVYGMERLGWHIYALYVVLVGSFVLLALNQWRSYRRVGKSKDYSFVERNYLKIDLATKALFTIVLILGLKK